MGEALGCQGDPRTVPYGISEIDQGYCQDSEQESDSESSKLKMPKFLTDENIPRQVVKRLREARYNVKTVSEVTSTGSSNSLNCP